MQPEVRIVGARLPVTHKQGVVLGANLPFDFAVPTSPSDPTWRPMDLTGCQPELVIFTTPGASPLARLNLTSGLLLEDPGSLGYPTRVQPDNVDTAEWAPTTYLYELWMTDAGGQRMPYLSDTWTVTASGDA